MDKWKKLPDYEHSVFDEADGFVCDCETAAMADKIIREHNAHEALVEALKVASGVLSVGTKLHCSCVFEVECGFCRAGRAVDAALAQAGETK